MDGGSGKIFFQIFGLISVSPALILGFALIFPAHCPKFRTSTAFGKKNGSLSNCVDNLENFTSEMEWNFFVPVGFSCVFLNWYSYVSTPPAFPLAWIHV
ncbi:hypothetical protein [Ligilactobacillus ruminis]|uniref:hypothetical protein n=1 Tax=Ligilactobacillus ruminis TaxID=1623 RepID=UPI001562AD94|nr:hypothetical protein [Ligilactobacillus ruminis]